MWNNPYAMTFMLGQTGITESNLSENSFKLFLLKSHNATEFRHDIWYAGIIIQCGFRCVHHVIQIQDSATIFTMEHSLKATRVQYYSM